MSLSATLGSCSGTGCWRDGGRESRCVEGQEILAAIFARCPEGFIEVRSVPRIRWAGAHPRDFFRLPDYAGAAEVAMRRRQDFDVYFGVAPRAEPPWYAGGCRHGGHEILDVPARVGRYRLTPVRRQARHVRTTSVGRR